MLAAVCGGLAFAAPAQAQATDTEVTATASGSLGGADIVVGGTPAQGGPVALCQVDGTAQNFTDGASVGSKVKYGKGNTKCVRDENGVASATVTGERFETTVLRQFGGPAIRVHSYTASCATTGNGSSAHIELEGVSGVQVPQDIPPNTVLTVPGRQQGDPPMAEVVLNELVAPTPPDGSLTANTMHIKLFPQGGPASGDILVGNASCDPFGG
jgi:hypothetical protein